MNLCTDRKKPDFNEWMKDPKNTCPQYILDKLDIENAFKTVVVNDDIFVVHDRDLKHAHICIAAEGKLMIFMKATINADENLIYEGGKQNMTQIGEYDE